MTKTRKQIDKEINAAFAKSQTASEMKELESLIKDIERIDTRGHLIREALAQARASERERCVKALEKARKAVWDKLEPEDNPDVLFSLKNDRLREQAFGYSKSIDVIKELK